ncbi:polyribonucleotide nucleotidyltransferase [Entomospira entomophila]|uniref:Polyribonucleotide nucleotidyltransferase n=1 Tax=Entomospira entomophila TaxID=2719988 RepID=A0A968G8V8_9SPIO|nr:polyribonucleotide nucleotidyltransferase [Entomospira entomophilus]NIZ40707.1 polyribonucleotide nucleotidyltransferase [Entomospira entomophilus]WDI34920.1 polyribonucleotide nucleotidyltransferase [Entomospira entomophilus]
MERAVFKIGQHDLVLETGKMGRQANGAVFATYAGVAVFATVCCSNEPGEPLDYVPVSVEYNEKYYAAGKIPGGFLKREARPKDKEILVSRLIDRPMRPLFYKEFGRDIQVIPTVVSADQIHTPDIVGMIAAFAAVQISDIPFNGPVAAVRVASLNGEFIINPTFEEIEKSQLDIVVASNPEGICMVEGGAHEVSEELMLDAIAHAEKVLHELLQFLRDFGAKAGKSKLPLPEKKASLADEASIIAMAKPKLAEACFVKGKQARHEAIDAVKSAVTEQFATEYNEEQLSQLSSLLEEIERTVVRDSILDKGLRTDGRSTVDIRDITCEIGLLQRAHGSALFTRGETQSLGVTTLGSTFDEQIMDNIDGDTRSRFMLHYNFPPFSVGETGRLNTGRREIGHGHLAQRALEPIIPSKDEFPYTIRVVSEILESNGSSSQATICSGSMALLHAGVPIKNSVAGIAMGLIKEGSRFAILSDILGEEDHLGDMDFKVAGSDKGITAFQMDIKCAGITIDIMRKALSQAHVGRQHILNIMNTCIKEPATPSEFAPSILTFKVEIDKIGAIIGPGGKNIKAIAESSQSKINIEDDGSITIAAKNQEQGEQARNYILALINDPEVGTIYQGTVKRLMDFGAFIEILPGKEGLCHISKISKQHVQKVSDVLKEGDVVKVKLIDIDKMGRLNLSISDV